MKTSHLVVLVGSIGASALGLYAVKSEHTRVALSTATEEQALPPAAAVDYQTGVVNDLKTLRRDVQLLKNQFADLRRLSAEDDLRVEVVALRSKVYSLENMLTELDNSALVGAAQEQRGDGPAPIETTEDDILFAAEERSLEDADRTETIAAEFQSELEEPEWSAATVETISTFFADSSDLAIDLKDVECRSTMCRIEAEFESTDAVEDFNLRFPLHVGTELPQATYENIQRDDGSIVVRAYMAREGFDFPEQNPDQ